MSNTTRYRAPRDPARWRAFALAAVVHAALFTLLWFGVNWQNETPVAVEAEVWSPQVREAAPKPRATPALESELQRPLPAPMLKPELTRETPPLTEIPRIKPPDIALEREKKRKLQERESARLKIEDYRKARLEAREDERRKTQAAQKAEQADARKRDLARQEIDRKRQQQAAQYTEAQSKKQFNEQQKKLRVENQQQKLDQQELAKAKAAHDDQVRRLAASIESPAGSGGSGDDAKSQGPRADANYTQKVGAKIKSNTIFNGADELQGNPAVEISVDLLPDGSIRRQRKLKSSGVPGFDEAVARAIDKSQPFPPDKSGTVPSSFIVSHKPKDQ
ncbi:MAG: cell envelope integrity protein TolA [Burkholderiaceae bacterium]